MRSHLELVSAAFAGYAVVASVPAAAAAAAVAASDQTQKKQVAFPGDDPSTSTCKVGRRTKDSPILNQPGLAQVGRLRTQLHTTRDPI